MTQQVVVAMSVSLDGIAGGATDDDSWPVHEALLGWQLPLASWRASQGMDGGRAGTDSQVWQTQFDRFGAQVVGRAMFDVGVGPWGDEPPFRAPVFVHTHRAGPTVRKRGGTTYHFVTDGIRSAVAAARTSAGGRDVLVAGGVQTARLALAAGLVDEVVLHVVPVVLGRGVTLLDPLRPAPMRPVAAVAGENAVHLTFATGSG